MKIYAMTEKGEHSENEDRILINGNVISNGFFETESNEKSTICIADGVGGNNAGAVASSFVCENLKNIVSVSKDSLININNRLIEISVSNDSFKGMATTLSGICIDDASANIFHIGNTRIYVFQGSYIKQITEDQTRVNWLVKTGKLSKKEAETYDGRNEIIACLGGENPALIKSLIFEESCKAILNSKRIVMTSDGIHEYVSDNDLEIHLNNRNIDVVCACREIIDIAKANGSFDDRSIVILDK